MGPFWSRADAVDLASDALSVLREPARAHAARRLSVATASGRQCPASSDRDLRLVHVHGARFIGASQPQPELNRGWLGPGASPLATRPR